MGVSARALSKGAPTDFGGGARKRTAQSVRPGDPNSFLHFSDLEHYMNCANGAIIVGICHNDGICTQRGGRAYGGQFSERTGNALLSKG